LVLELAGRLIIGEITDPALTLQAKHSAADALQDPSVPSSLLLLNGLMNWVDFGRTGPSTVAFLQSVLGAKDDAVWVTPVLTSAAQSLRAGLKSAAQDVESAGYFSGPVSLWLELTGQTEQLDATERELRNTAFETLLGASLLEDAEDLLPCFPDDFSKRARWHEAAGNHEEAARFFEQAVMMKDALRNWRMAGNWEMALRLAVEDDLLKLRWLDSLTKQMLTKPEGLREWLTSAELKRMKAILRAE